MRGIAKRRHSDGDVGINRQPVDGRAKFVRFRLYIGVTTADFFQTGNFRHDFVFPPFDFIKLFKADSGRRIYEFFLFGSYVQDVFGRDRRFMFFRLGFRFFNKYRGAAFGFQKVENELKAQRSRRDFVTPVKVFLIKSVFDKFRPLHFDDARFFKRFQKRVLILAVSDKGKFFHINDCHIL